MKNTLQLNEQTKSAILRAGLKLDETIAEINATIEKYGIIDPVNYLDITYKNKETGETSIYLIHYWEDENGRNYDYLEKKCNYDHFKPFKIKTHLQANAKKYILDMINNHACSKDFLKSGKPQNDYTIKELENGKPNTLLKAKNKNFVCFFAVGVPFNDLTPNINEFNINEEKETSISIFFNCFSSWEDSNRARINATKIYVCYNSKMGEYQQNKNTIFLKHKEREETKKQLFLQNRYLYTDADYKRFLNDYYYILKWWNIAQCELTRTSADSIESESYIEYKGLKIYHNCETRPQLYNYLFDKNGFCKLENIYNLRTRAEELRRKKAQEIAEEKRKQWKTSDKTKQKEEINRYLTYLHIKISELLTFDLIMNCDRFDELKKYREIYKDLSKLLVFENYADFDTWEKKKEEKLKNYDFYMRAINKNMLSSVGCPHQYEKTSTGYKMIPQYANDNYWGNHYAKEF